MGKILAPVGRGAANRNAGEIRLVQELLNRNRKAGTPALAIDGLAGPKTIAAIEEFQRRVLSMARPDGRVDPGGRTFAALNGMQGLSSSGASRLAVAIVDGTGPYEDADYFFDLRDSFCSQMKRALGDQCQYERGPSGEGYRIRERAQRAVDYLLERYRANPQSRLMLAGYSRGGSIAVMAARMIGESLGETGVIESLFLFDPVARHLSGDTETIPANVRTAYIARRRWNDPSMDKYDYTLPLFPRGAGHNPVRRWFGTTATRHEPGVTVINKEFLGSHGALGGVGWAHVSEDPQAQREVAAFFNQALRLEGVPVRLAPGTPSSKPPGSKG